VVLCQARLSIHIEETQKKVIVAKSEQGNFVLHEPATHMCVYVLYLHNVYMYMLAAYVIYVMC